MAEQVMTDIEAIVVGWLRRHKIVFQFATSLRGGFFELGGAVVDILIPDRQLAWRIMGEYWHRGTVPEGKDAIQREMLTALGWKVVDLWSDDIKNKLDETLRRALLGEEMLR